MPRAVGDGAATGAAGAPAGWVGICRGTDAGGLGAGAGTALRCRYKNISNCFIYIFMSLAAGNIAGLTAINKMFMLG